jgi:hypothetical protein
MLGIALGDARSDVTNFVKSIPLVGDYMASGLPKIEAYIKGEAKAGAEEAIPDITQKVHDEAEATIRPYVIGALALGGIGAFFGIAALIKIKRKN